MLRMTPFILDPAFSLVAGGTMLDGTPLGFVRAGNFLAVAGRTFLLVSISKPFFNLGVKLDHLQHHRLEIGSSANMPES